MIHLKGVLEDVLVKVRQFIISIDFVVLDFEEDHEILLLLERLFLATSKSTIDLKKNELIMKIDRKVEVFKCGNPSKDEEPEDYLGESYNSYLFEPQTALIEDMLVVPCA